LAMLRSHHHLHGLVKLVLWDVYCVNGCGSFRLGYVRPPTYTFSIWGMKNILPTSYITYQHHTWRQ